MNRYLITVAALALAGIAQAAEPGKVQSAASSVGAAASSAATRTGNAVKRGAAKTGEVASTTAERTKEGVEEGADKTKRGAKRVKKAMTPASSAS